MSTFPVERRGDRNAAVRVIQYLLTDRGVAVMIDGIFGSHLEVAVKTFQAGHGLLQDGIVGEQTWSHLIRTLQTGSNGAAVEAVQVILSRVTTPMVDVDGVFGPKTKAAVTNFQAEHGLVADGIVGPQTWRAVANAAAGDTEDV